MPNDNTSNKVNTETSQELAQLRSAIAGTITAIMMINRDLKVTYANRATQLLLKKHEHALGSLFRNFDANNIVGTCIDVFHKDPAYQRHLLSDPANLPHSADIQVGPLTFNINVSAQLDLDGNYIGNTLEWYDVTEQRVLDAQNADYRGQIEAISRSQAIIEFDMTGRILWANDNFLGVMGYTLGEIQGQHHSMFAEPTYASSMEYQIFWQKLKQGEYDAGEYKRLGKHGKEVWIQATYNPIRDKAGNLIKVVKYATDVTKQKLRNANYEGQIDAISKSQAVIEFNMDGTIITANDNFLNTVGYRLGEIQGRHHRMFAEPEYANSLEYRLFWEKLNQGLFDSGEYRRLGKNGKEIWIQASYNPILDLNGKPFKIVKYAVDITAQKHALSQIKKLVDAAKQGELNRRVDSSHYQGFVKQLIDDINVMLDAIVTPMRESSRIMQHLADGDLTQKMNGRFQGEFATLQQAINGCMDNLQDMVNQIKGSADSIKTSAGEIAMGNEDLSRRTEQQAASLQETASSMEEITSTVKKNADNARHASQLASDTATAAEKGGQVVASAITAVAGINSASKKIADIIGVIDEIAFQTNLLALNAAVEAARAGEQGRGFAVVAAEVRNLAQRSAGAAKEIKVLIKDSVQKVEEGSRLVNESGQQLTTIVSSVKQVSTIISEIAAASREQSAGIDEVNKAITKMDQSTQQNAALVEEATAASESMDEESQSLTKLIGFFKVH